MAAVVAYSVSWGMDVGAAIACTLLALFAYWYGHRLGRVRGRLDAIGEMREELDEHRRELARLWRASSDRDAELARMWELSGCRRRDA